MYQLEDKESREVFSVYYHVGDMLHIKYISAYTQEEADSKGRDMGLDVVDSDMI